jgi:hypothetical protein
MALNTGFQGLPISEVVPDAIAGMQEGLSKSSLLVSRRKIRFQPQTGTTATPGSIVQFVLADSSSLLDMNSATISFTVTTSTAGTAAAPVALDDGISVFRRMQCSLNGNLVSDVDHAHRLCNMEVYGSADKSWYQSAAGGFAGFWKFNPDMATGVYPTTTAAPMAGAYNPAFGDIAGDVAGAGTAGATWISAGTRHAAGEARLVPLSLIDGFFRCKQYVPLSLLGELVISFTLASNAEAFLTYSDTTATYSLSDIFCEVDLVQPHYALNEIMLRQANSEGENGIVIPYESAIVSQGQAITSGTASVIVSRATNNLRRMLYAHQLTSGLSLYTFPAVSCFGFNACSNWQVRCGSLYFPSQPATTSARMYGLLASSYGDAVNEKPGVMNRLTYTQTSATIASTPLKLCYTDNFIVGYNFDSYKNTGGTNVLDADGLSVLGQAGSQVVVQVTQTGSVSPVVSLHATRYLSLQNGTLKIIGV